MTLTPEQALQCVQTTAEAIRNDEPQRFPDAASVGDVFRQGDIYIELLAGVPDGCKQMKKPNSQLAPGTTQGSRHVLDSLRFVKMFTRSKATVLDGPVLLIERERTITHPEHGWLILPKGVYGVTYQRQFADELRRVAD